MKTIGFACAALLAFAAAAARAADAPPTDAQIAHIVVTANQVDVDAGNLAREHAQNKDVQSFAVRMVTDHGGVNKQATELAGKLHLTPEANPTSASLKRGGDDNLAALSKLSGAAFDKAYVDHEVAYHEAVLGAVDKTLIPNAKNAELKALLVQSRPVFESHLEHAKQLQAALGK
jgi:putative membrane protein